MPLYLTCEADLDLPVPNARRIADELRARFDSTRPVTTLELARAAGCDVVAVEDVLRRAARQGLVRRIGEKGWVPATTR